MKQVSRIQFYVKLQIKQKKQKNYAGNAIFLLKSPLDCTSHTISGRKSRMTTQKETI